MAYSLAHAVSIWHKVVGRTAGWAVTGVAARKSGVSGTIAKLGLVMIVLNLVLPTAVLTRDILQFGWKEYWPTALFLLLYAYLAVPLAWGFIRLLFPSRSLSASAPKRKAPRRPITSGQIGWLRAVATTVAIGLLSVASLGVFNAYVGW